MFLLRPESQDIPWELLEATEFAQARTKSADMAIFCADLLGRRFRFVVTEGEKCRFTYPSGDLAPGNRSFTLLGHRPSPVGWLTTQPGR